jgi:lysophospholipase L1-like esterase
MNINPQAKRILCYGDSNTWGFIPGTGNRYAPDIRWTGLLQKALGDGFEIIEEGLNGRTTAFEHPDATGKNGATYLKSCLPSHYPVDLVILMLGTNDLRESLQKTPAQIADGIDELLSIIDNSDYNYGSKPEVIILAPPIVDESADGVKDDHSKAQEKSEQWAEYYNKVAEKNNCEFINTAEFLESSKIDGFHLDKNAQVKLAEMLVRKIKQIYG